MVKDFMHEQVNIWAREKSFAFFCTNKDDIELYFDFYEIKSELWYNKFNKTVYLKF